VVAAARDWGFFHLVNYHHVIHPPLFSSGYPVRALAAVRAFNELPGPDRAKHYGRAPVTGGVSYSSNVDLFRSPSASWRDTMEIENVDPACIPAACRAELLDWDAQATAVGVFDIRPIKKDALDIQVTGKLNWTFKPPRQTFLTPSPFRLHSVRI
jgi:hypothetical protein